jgi:ribosomal protein L37AE/L43A
MNLRLPRLGMPIRLRHQTRVVAIQCRLCGRWVKPRRIRIPAMVCRHCETTPAFQSWNPTTRTPVTTGRQTVSGGA